MTKLHNILDTLSNEAKQEILKGLRDGSLLEMLSETRTPIHQLQRHQVVPDGNWYMYALLGGRGAGKTYASSAWAAQKLTEKGGTRIGVVVSSYRAVENFVVYVSQHIPDEYSPKYIHATSKLELSNGSSITFYPFGSTNMRGSCFHYGVVSEAQDQFRSGRDGQLIQELVIGTRLGKNPQVFVEGHDELEGSDELIEYLNSVGTLIRYVKSTYNVELSQRYLRNLMRMGIN